VVKTEVEVDWPPETSLSYRNTTQRYDPEYRELNTGQNFGRKKQTFSTVRGRSY